MSLVGVRTSRHAPLRLATWDGPAIPEGEVVLLDCDGALRLGYVVLTASQIVDPAASPTTDPKVARVIAAGRSDASIRSALATRAETTRAVVQAVIGAGVEVVEVNWSDDLARLTVALRGRGDLDPEDARRRLAARLRTSVRLGFPSSTSANRTLLCHDARFGCSSSSGS